MRTTQTSINTDTTSYLSLVDYCEITWLLTACRIANKAILIINVHALSFQYVFFIEVRLMYFILMKYILNGCKNLKCLT